jgi:outer membrane protein assembly factor BamA
MDACAELPAYMAAKKPISDRDFEDKKEGRYFTGLPLANSDPDTGFGFGARAYLFDNGEKCDALFRYTPYRMRTYAQLFATTTAYQYHTLDLDMPYVDREPIRIRASLVYERNTAANYFGIGPHSLDRLAFPGAQRSYAALSDYTDALRDKRTDGTAFTRYDQYILERPFATATVQRDYFGGVVRALVGFTAEYVNVSQWTGRTVESSDGDAKQAPTRLQADCDSGKVKGCEGGFIDALKLGIAFDTRDYEPDPTSGVFIDLTTELSGRPIGSRYDWARVTFSPRAYFSPVRKLTFAGRIVESIVTADAPFYEMNQLSFSDSNRSGLGGLRTIRGYKQDRFVGRAMTLANLEARWKFWETDLKRQHFAFMLVPFVDVGRVFDAWDDFEFARFRNGQGAGIRIAWNQATIIVADFGVSREGSSLYINFDHPF